MAYIALRKFQANGKQIQKGETVPAEKWPTKRALLSRRWIAETAAAPAATGNPDPDITKGAPGGQQAPGAFQTGEDLTGDNGTPAGAEGQEKQPDANQGTPDDTQGDGSGSTNGSTTEPPTEEVQMAAQTLIELSVEKMTAIIKDLGAEDLPVLNLALELDERKTGKEAIQEKIAELTNKGE